MDMCRQNRDEKDVVMTQTRENVTGKLLLAHGMPGLRGIGVAARTGGAAHSAQFGP